MQTTLTQDSFRGKIKSVHKVNPSLTFMMIYEQRLNQSFRGTVLTAASECVSLNQQMVLQGQPVASLFGSAWHARICQKMILGYQGAILVPSCGITNLNATKNQKFVELIWYQPFSDYAFTGFLSGFLSRDVLLFHSRAHSILLVLLN